MRRGFSLLELLLFLSLASIAIAIISAFLITLNRSNQENTTREAVEEDARFIRKTLTTAIQDAQSVRTPDADTQANSLTLITKDNNEVTYLRRNDNFYKERSDESNERLNSENVLITKFSVNHIDPNTSEEGDAAIRFSITAEYDTPSGAPQAFEYQHTQTINHTVSLGNRPLANVPDPDSDSIKFWLRADRGVVTDENGKVARWYDQSGNEYTATQPNSGDRPADYLTNELNGYPTVDFSGGYLAIRDWVYDTANTIDGITIFAVAKTSNTNDQILISFDASEYFRFSMEATDGDGKGINWATESNTHLTTKESYTDGNFYLLDTFFSNSENPDKRISVNADTKTTTYQHSGSKLGSGNTRYGFVGSDSTDSSTSFNSGGNTNTFQGQLAELIVYDKALSESKRQEVRAYLNEKYELYKSIKN